MEEMLISRAFPIMQIYTKPRGGQVSYRGHIITLPNDVKKIANILPHSSSEIPIIVFKFCSTSGKSKVFKCAEKMYLIHCYGFLATMKMANQITFCIMILLLIITFWKTYH